MGKSWVASGKSHFLEKLKRVKKDLKSWNISDFGNIDENIKRLEVKISKWDRMASERTLDGIEMQERRKTQADLWNWLKKKELLWAQNSRALWLKHGDRNTNFFHTFTSLRRQKNSITSLICNNLEVSQPDAIMDEVVRYFSNLFQEEDTNRPTFSDLNFNKLSNEQAAALILPLSHTEIDEAVSSCNPSKALGPDGFNFQFIKSAWHIINEDVYANVEDFWKTGKLPKGSNVAFIALITKIESPREFKDFRPISMVGCIYKIIVKVLVNRLKRVMNDLIGPFQSSFLEGRQILDGALIAGELLESCKSSKSQAIFLKLDFHKAFDSISWAFLN